MFEYTHHKYTVENVLEYMRYYPFISESKNKWLCFRGGIKWQTYLLNSGEIRSDEYSLTVSKTEQQSTTSLQTQFFKVLLSSTSSFSFYESKIKMLTSVFHELV